VTLERSDLGHVGSIRDALAGADAVAHVAGAYRVGIAPGERPAMWDANVGTTERVLDAAIAARVPRILYVSSAIVFGNTRGRLVDETHRRDEADGFTSWYDETKYRAHRAAEARIAAGGPIVIGMPGQVYGPHDHSLAGQQLARAHAGTLRYVALGSCGLAWVHVDDLADGLVAALDHGRTGESYSLAGECRRMDESIAIAAAVGGHRPPRLRIPTALLRAVAPLNDRLGGLPGMPANARETISSAEQVTFWARHDAASAELGFAPRSLAQGIADTWGDRRQR
jgi:dihydroflavonol-4-reductase